MVTTASILGNVNRSPKIRNTAPSELIRRTAIKHAPLLTDSLDLLEGSVHVRSAAGSTERARVRFQDFGQERVVGAQRLFANGESALEVSDSAFVYALRGVYTAQPDE